MFRLTYVIMSSFYCIYTILSNADRDIGYLLFLWPYKYAPMAATHGTVDIMPTERDCSDKLNSHKVCVY